MQLWRQAVPGIRIQHPGSWTVWILACACLAAYNEVCVLQSYWAYGCLYLMYDKSAELKAKTASRPTAKSAHNSPLVNVHYSKVVAVS